MPTETSQMLQAYMTKEGTAYATERRTRHQRNVGIALALYDFFSSTEEVDGYSISEDEVAAGVTAFEQAYHLRRLELNDARIRGAR